MTSSRKPEYYCPLSSNSFKDGPRGPSQCAFSSPKVTYSQETHDFINVLMNETRLTTSQRKGFQSILRSGDATHPDSSAQALARRQEYLRRRVEKGRAIGLDVPSGLNVNKLKKGPGNQLGAGKRSLDAIKATGALDCSTQGHTYVPVNKEAEKVRFSYKMTYGQAPSQEVMNRLMGKGKTVDSKKVSIPPTKSTDELNQERLTELIEEIKERVEFMESVGKTKQKEYQGYMTYQIREKLEEVKGLFPGKARELVQSLRLTRIDPLFGEI